MKKNTIQIIIGIIILLILVVMFFFTDTSTVKDNEVLSIQEAKYVSEKIINELLVTEDSVEVKVEKVTEESGIYKLDITVNGQAENPLFMTKDGKRIITESVSVQELQEEKNKKEVQSAEILNSTERENILKDFLGKPSVIFLTTTTCPFCVEALPKYETKIWDIYNEKVNIFVNVLNDQKFTEQRIAQGHKPELSFQNITGEECGYVPSYVILNSLGEVVKKTCGANVKNINDIALALDNLLKNN